MTRVRLPIRSPSIEDSKMSIELIESIVNGDYVSANELFEERLADIQEKKLYEVKRMIAAMNEVVKPVPGKPGEFQGANTKADWAKYRKQTKLPKRKFAEPPATPFGAGKKLSKGDIERRREAGYVKAEPAIRAKRFVDAVIRYHKTGKINENSLPPFVSGVSAGGKEAEKLGKQGKELPRSPEAIPKSAKKSKEKPEKSRWLRRAELEKRRQSRIASTDSPLKAARLMTRKEIGKSIIKKAGSIASGVASDIASAVALEE